MQFDLSQKGIDKMIGELRKKKKAMSQDQAQRFLTMATERGRYLVQENLMLYDKVDSGKLVNSVQTEVDAARGVGYVRVTDKAALYVEYGTGVVGRDKRPHPNKPAGWQYNVGRTINPVTHKWRFFKWGKWNTTMGQEASPFFYNAERRLRDELPSIAREVFKQ